MIHAENYVAAWLEYQQENVPHEFKINRIHFVFEGPSDFSLCLLYIELPTGVMMFSPIHYSSKSLKDQKTFSGKYGHALWASQVTIISK